MIDSEVKVQSFSAVMSAVTIVLGFAAPWPEVIVGLFYAIGGGFANHAVSPPDDKMALPATVLVAIIIGLFAGIAHPHFVVGGALTGWVSALPVQLVMGVSGLASPWLARRAVAGNISLPWSKGGGQ